MLLSDWKVIRASRSERQSPTICYWDVRKTVEASLDIEVAIDQTSCFSKTIVMNITLVDSELTSQIDFSAQLELNMSVASCQLIGKTWRINSATAQIKKSTRSNF